MKTINALNLVLVLSVLATVSCMKAIAQTKEVLATKMHSLDTIIFIPSIARNDAGLKGVSYCANKETITLNYYNKHIHGDTLRFYTLNTKSYQVDSFDCVIKKIATKLKNYPISSIDKLNNKLIVLINDVLYLITLEKDKRNNSIKKIELGKGEFYETVKFIDESKVFLYRSYNYYFPKNPEFKNTKIAVFSLTNSKEINSIYPTIYNTELSHMGPYEPISTYGNKLIIGQNIHYQFSIYDEALNLYAQYTGKKEPWNPIDSAALRKINTLSGSDKTALMSYLQPKFLSGYSLCDGYILTDTNTILVRYTIGNNGGDTIRRLFDVIKLSEGKKWVLSDTTWKTENKLLLPKESEYGEKITTENFYTDIWLNKTLFNESKSYIFMKRSMVYPLGLGKKEYFMKDYQYKKSKDAVFSVTILKNKF